MKKMGLLALLLAAVMLVSGCSGQSKTSVSSSEGSEEAVMSDAETVSSEGTDWYWLATDGAEMAKDFIEENHNKFLE